MRVDKRVLLSWTGTGREFEGGLEGGPRIVVDGNSTSGPSSMDLVLTGVAACMAIDVLVVMEKQRLPVEGLEVKAEGSRAEDYPRRYTALRLTYRLTGLEPKHRPKVERAIELSREKYCSALHSIRTDIPIEIVIEGV